MTKILHDYIAQARNKGFSDKDISDQLKSQGWQENDIAQAIGVPKPTSSKKSPSRIPKTYAILFGIMAILFILGMSIPLFFILSIGGSPINLKAQIVILLLFGLPIGLVLLSMISVLRNKGFSPFSFLPEGHPKTIADAIGKIALILTSGVLIYYAIQLFIYVINY